MDIGAVLCLARLDLWWQREGEGREYRPGVRGRMGQEAGGGEGRMVGELSVLWEGVVVGEEARRWEGRMEGIVGGGRWRIVTIISMIRWGGLGSRQDRENPTEQDLSLEIYQIICGPSRNISTSVNIARKTSQYLIQPTYVGTHQELHGSSSAPDFN